MAARIACAPTVKPIQSYTYRTESFPCPEISLCGDFRFANVFDNDGIHVKESDFLGVRGPKSNESTFIYRIGSESKKLAKFSMYKSFVNPGEEFMLSFDFSDANIPCYQITVGIECVETAVGDPPLQVS